MPIESAENGMISCDGRNACRASSIIRRRFDSPINLVTSGGNDDACERGKNVEEAIGQVSKRWHIENC